MEHTLITWLGHYGPVVLFFAQMFGIFGVPIPDELLLTVAGALVRHGELNGPATVFAAIGGCSTGITGSYLLGRTVGITTLHRVLHIRESSLARAQRWFKSFGVWLLAFGYFVPGVRHVTAIAAGSTPLDYWQFARAAYPGAVLWCAVFLGTGYIAGDRLGDLTLFIQGHLGVAGAVLFAAAAIYILVTTRWAHVWGTSARR
jgi:membrane protein DedA with SNARE-associated domain